MYAVGEKVQFVEFNGIETVLSKGIVRDIGDFVAKIEREDSGEVIEVFVMNLRERNWKFA